MTPTTVDPSQVERGTTVGSRLLDAAGRATHAAHEVQLLKSMAADAIEDGKHVVERTMKRSIHRAEDLKDEAVHQVKRHPLKAVCISVGAGLVAGVVIGWIGTWLITRTRPA